jgi:ABC-2 type transport system permease protein|tara:strand:+ start:106 stop:873 length:768 start_codon:yes stop_codon:yes gene_type:complete
MSNFSYLAFKTILHNEIKTYLKQFQFNIIAPLINTLLFVFILSTISKYYISESISATYIEFLIPGIVMTVIFQSGFNHLSEVIISMKQSGSFNDYLVSPISRVEIFLSLLTSSIILCIIVAIVNLIALSFFLDFIKINSVISLYYLILAIITFSSLGALVGFLSYTWDAQSSVSTFFIVPISFFSGSFFSIDVLDNNLKFIFEMNPLYYLIKGFRSSFFEAYQITFLNHIFINLFVFFIFISSLLIFKKGYKVIN